VDVAGENEVKAGNGRNFQNAWPVRKEDSHPLSTGSLIHE
jgi:hypothetical protein